MTIKELEKRTGLDRATIRFYEKEGLIAPKRLANGYRDYSEEDVLALEKIAAGDPGDAAAMMPNYLRLSQAERERAERAAKNKE